LAATFALFFIKEIFVFNDFPSVSSNILVSKKGVNALPDILLFSAYLIAFSIIGTIRSLGISSFFGTGFVIKHPPLSPTKSLYFIKAAISSS